MEFIMSLAGNLVMDVLALGLAWWSYKVVYSIFFSPMKDIPSPIELQLVPLLFKLGMAIGQTHTVVHYYHLKYGPIFRVGWTQVIYLGADASEIFRTYKYLKSPSYAGLGYFGNNLLATHTREDHRIRRTRLGPALTRANVMAMEKTVVDVGIRPLLENLTRACHKGPIDLFQELKYMNYDVIGELGFGKSFGMLKGKNRKAIGWMDLVTLVGGGAILFPFFSFVRIPQGVFLRKTLQKLLDSYQPNKVDIVSQLKNSDMTRDEILSEAFSSLIGGADTFSGGTTALFYLLVTSPDVYQKVADEVRAIKPNPDGILDYKSIKDLKYLQATIKEALRLYPSISVVLARTPPKGGSVLGGHFIPEDSEVSAPLYSLHRSPLHWDLPDAFLPERWLESDFPGIEKKINPSCYLPFLSGPRACIGKDLSIMQLSLMTANILNRFDFHHLNPGVGMGLMAVPALKAWNPLLVQVSSI